MNTNKSHLEESKAVTGGIAATLAIGAALTLYKLLLKRGKNKKTSIGIRIAFLRSSLRKCSKSKNPEICLAKIEEEIERLNLQKLRFLESKILGVTKMDTKKIIDETTECWCQQASLIDVSPQQTQVVTKDEEIADLLDKLEKAPADKKKEILGLILMKKAEIKNLEEPVRGNRAPVAAEL